MAAFFRHKVIQDVDSFSQKVTYRIEKILKSLYFTRSFSSSVLLYKPSLTFQECHKNSLTVLVLNLKPSLPSRPRDKRSTLVDKYINIAT